MKRATRGRNTQTVFRSYFNPRPREEGDLVLLKDVLFVNDFNPRPREEGDTNPMLKIQPSDIISIHALVKRATRPSQ